MCLSVPLQHSHCLSVCIYVWLSDQYLSILLKNKQGWIHNQPKVSFSMCHLMFLPIYICQCVKYLLNVANLRLSAPGFYLFHLVLCSYDYNMHVEGLLPASLCLVNLISSEQCSQLERCLL